MADNTIEALLNRYNQLNEQLTIILKSAIPPTDKMAKCRI